MKYSHFYKYKDYTFTIVTDETSLLELNLNKKIHKNAANEINSLMENVISQLDEYFSGKRKIFQLPIRLAGTEFQRKVWGNLLKIPYGKTISYKELAGMSGNTAASRAAGMANNRNPVPIIIPCHRVIGSNGHLTGYRGGLDLKKELLELEKNNL